MTKTDPRHRDNGAWGPNHSQRYLPLAPRADMLKMPYEQYRPLYLAILERLDPAQVVKDLEFLAETHEPVLLCYERPPLTATNWCHRSMVAEWLEGKLGMSVPEMT